MTDVTNRQQVSGFDVPTLVVPTHDASVKGVSFQLADLDITTEMSELPVFYQSALSALASADGVIELVWRLSDFGMDAGVRGTTLNTTSQSQTVYKGSHGIGGWASLFQFSLKDIAPSFDASSGRINIGSSENLLGRCNQGRATAANNATIQADGRLLNHSGTVSDMSQNGFWPTELNVMRGIVTSQETGVGKPFNNMPTLPAISTGNQYSTAEHYINFIGKEITGARTGSGLFNNTVELLNHLIKETGYDSATDVSGVQFKLWQAIHNKLTASNEQDANTDNIATKLVKAMLDTSIVTTDADRTKMKNRFFAVLAGDAENPSGDSSIAFKRFGPDGGNCAGVLSGVDFSHDSFDNWIDVPLSHGDVIEFNLTLTGASNTGEDPADPSTINVTTGEDRFGSGLPGSNAIRTVVYRVKIHLEGADTRAAA